MEPSGVLCRNLLKLLWVFDDGFPSLFASGLKDGVDDIVTSMARVAVAKEVCVRMVSKSWDTSLVDIMEVLSVDCG